MAIRKKQDWWRPHGTGYLPDWGAQSEKLCANIIFPPPESDHARLSCRLPSPTQITTVLDKVFHAHQAALNTKQILDVLKYGFKLPSKLRKSYDETEEQDADDSTTDEESNTGNQNPDADELIPIPPPLPGELHTDDEIDRIIDELIDRVQQHDRCNIDPPPQDSSKGRLGKALLDWIIWYNPRDFALDVKILKTALERRKVKLPKNFWNANAREYTMKVYTTYSGLSMGTLDTIMRRDMRKVSKEITRTNGVIAVQQLHTVIHILRNRYRHRKPEFIVDRQLVLGD